MSWSDEKEDKRTKLYNEGLGDREIAERSEPPVSVAAICAWRRNRFLPPNKGKAGRVFSEQENEVIYNLYKQGYDDLEIAKKVLRPRTSIKGWRNKRGLPANAKQGGQTVWKREQKDS
jgi:hypothetical protein